jgi:hypothetical protein
MRHRVLIAAALVGTAALPSTAAAAGSPGFKQSNLTLEATNGYTLLVSGSAGSKSLLMMATKGRGGTGATVSYSVTGSVSTTRLKGSFGPVGEVDVEFEPRRTTVRSIGKPCKASRKQATTTGVWRGTIRFKGERGYSKVTAKSAKGAVITYPPMTCTSPPKVRNVYLTATSGGSGSQALSVSRRGTTTHFGAGIGETRGKVTINRSVSVGSGTFSYDSGLTSATVATEAGPFSGRGRYTETGGNTGTFTGDLSVAFPGLAGRVPLAGPTFLGTLSSFRA